MNMAEFKAGKAALYAKWGDKVVTGTGAEMAAIAKEAAPLAKFAKLRPEKFMWSLAMDYTVQKAAD